MGRRKGYRVPIRERLERFIDKSGGPTACWPWTGGRTKGKPGEPEYDKGYGMFIIVHEDGTREGRTAHSVVYEEYVGPIPEGHRVLHKCDNPACGNPSHLFLGTHRENMADAWAKGRPVCAAPGDANYGAKLTQEQVAEIRAGQARDAELAALFGVKRTTIWAARTGATWWHVRHTLPEDKAG